jgi:hypothetical protein
MATTSKEGSRRENCQTYKVGGSDNKYLRVYIDSTGMRWI